MIQLVSPISIPSTNDQNVAKLGYPTNVSGGDTRKVSLIISGYPEVKVVTPSYTMYWLRSKEDFEN